MGRCGGQTVGKRRVRGAVEIANIRMTGAGPISRVQADVNGVGLWFESADIPLLPQAEAFGCAVLPAAIAHRADLAVDAPFDAVWCRNVGAIQDVWRRWWRIRKARLYPSAEEKRSFRKARGLALCFSGGVDSFYSLLRSGFAFDHLVFIHGYDAKLADTRRAEAAERSLREVAHAVGAKAVLVRTNLREHPTFRSTDWEKIHGGALAAVGHLLCRQVGGFVISSSYPYYHDVPWGSHWKVDPLWSSSEVEIIHYGSWLWRKEKLEALAGEELVRRHLRVCWESRDSQANCGCCEKCLRTMLILALANQLEHFPNLGGGADLADRLNRLPCLSPTYFPNYAEFLHLSSNPQITEALRALLVRSRIRKPGLIHCGGSLLRRGGNILGRPVRRWVGYRPMRSELKPSR